MSKTENEVGRMEEEQKRLYRLSITRTSPDNGQVVSVVLREGGGSEAIIKELKENQALVAVAIAASGENGCSVDELQTLGLAPFQIYQSVFRINSKVPGGIIESRGTRSTANSKYYLAPTVSVEEKTLFKLRNHKEIQRSPSGPDKKAFVTPLIGIELHGKDGLAKFLKHPAESEFTSLRPDEVILLELLSKKTDGIKLDELASFFEDRARTMRIIEIFLSRPGIFQGPISLNGSKPPIVVENGKVRSTVPITVIKNRREKD